MAVPSSAASAATAAALAKAAAAAEEDAEAAENAAAKAQADAEATDRGLQQLAERVLSNLAVDLVTVVCICWAQQARAVADGSADGMGAPSKEVLWAEWLQARAKAADGDPTQLAPPKLHDAVDQHAAVAIKKRQEAVRLRMRIDGRALEAWRQVSQNWHSE
jgi:hypothetical protein